MPSAESTQEEAQSQGPSWLGSALGHTLPQETCPGGLEMLSFWRSAGRALDARLELTSKAGLLVMDGCSPFRRAPGLLHQGWLYGHVTCGVAQGLVLTRAPHLV